jgi:multidrug efflux pump subunit AcrA (membrane-fusion protein)
MACKLTPVPHSPHRFSGPAGQTVTLTIAGDQAPAILSVVYAGAVVNSPWTFTIKPGMQVLVMIVSNAPNALTIIQEKCNGTANILQAFEFDELYPRVFQILGV